jgi:hypothetical protein
LRKLDGKKVIVTGSLYMKSHAANSAQFPEVMVLSIRVDVVPDE